MRDMQDAIHGKQGNTEPSPVLEGFRFALYIAILRKLKSKQLFDSEELILIT